MALKPLAQAGAAYGPSAPPRRARITANILALLISVCGDIARLPRLPEGSARLPRTWPALRGSALAQEAMPGFRAKK